MEILLDFVAELYIELMMLLVPEKQFGKKMTRFLQVVCAFVSIVIVSLIIVGASIVTDPTATNERTAGIICLTIGCSLLVIHLMLFIFVLIKKGLAHLGKNPEMRQP